MEHGMIFNLIEFNQTKKSINIFNNSHFYELLNPTKNNHIQHTSPILTHQTGPI
jgi:hypothetical protein